MTIGNTTYDQDLSIDTAATSEVQTRAKWAASNTGHLLDNIFPYNYTTQNISKLSVTDAEAELYMNARISPLSLTYYGFCLGNGKYTVKLHFAEIMFTDDNTYNSLGRRVFDVYIQGERVLKDFNIANEAQGTGKALTKRFSANVSNKALEIRFSWAGKGSTGIPHRSVYGPLISAISVTSDFIPPLPSSSNSIPTWVVVVIATATLIILISVVGILWWRLCLRNNNSLAKEFKDLDMKTGMFTLRQIKVATNNFNISNKIGEGGFGPVYKAHMLKEEGKLMELVDERLGSNFNEEEVMVMINVALLCTNVTSNLRPTMSSVLSMLEGKSMVPEFVPNTNEAMDEMKLEAMRQYYNQIEESTITVTQSQSLSIKGPWTSSSATDLYPIDLNSSYWETKKIRDSV
ncbi:LRR receptor serine/threonine-protein kinase [Spatholobus suberectus]|nr:LRR receptor serine/threonine-protein kinase [Spatholobus suberectus]